RRRRRNDPPSGTDPAVDQRPADLPIITGAHRARATARDYQGRRHRVPCSDCLQDQQTCQILEIDMKIIYDKETDTLSIILRRGKIAESDEPRPGLILDYDKAGRLVSIELLDASEQVGAPEKVEF